MSNNLKIKTMNRIKKIIGVIVVTMFLSAMTLNIGLFRNAYADGPSGRECPGWDGYSAFCGWTGDEQHPCQIVAYCTMVCLYGC